ncbi:hypothetical protein PINS_up021455 [Pythium insidiosum]|nr:hypothetical protein PINS_up021455 [Pythium insidiosum]
MWVSDSSTSALAYRVAHNVSSAEEGTEQHAGDVAHGVVWSPWQKNSSVIGASASWCSSADVVLLQKPDVAQSIVVHTNVSFLDPSSLLAVLVRVEHEVLRGATLSSVLDRVEWNGENLLPSASGVAASSSSVIVVGVVVGVVVVVKLAKEGGAKSCECAGRWKIYLTAGPVSLRSVILVNESLRLSMRDTLSMALRRAAVSPELSAALASIGSGPASGWSSSKFEVERVDMWVSDSSTSALAYRVAHNVSSAEEGTEQHAGRRGPRRCVESMAKEQLGDRSKRKLVFVCGCGVGAEA